MAQRADPEKAGEAFRAAMLRMIEAGEACAPTEVSKVPSTRNPIVVVSQ
jgi:hypothetical protein